MGIIWATEHKSGHEQQLHCEIKMTYMRADQASQEAPVKHTGR